MKKWLAELIKRDGPCCHLCGNPVDVRTMSAAGKQPLLASRDHVIPWRHEPTGKRTRGGHKAMRRTPQTHLADKRNVRLAHRFCNSYRGDREITPELKRDCGERLLRKMIRCGCTDTQATFDRLKTAAEAALDKHRAEMERSTECPLRKPHVLEMFRRARQSDKAVKRIGEAAA